jgi:hypothetical protein
MSTENHFDIVRQANFAMRDRDYIQSKALFIKLLQLSPSRSILVIISAILRFIDHQQVEVALSLIEEIKPFIESQLDKDKTIKQALKICTNRLKALNHSKKAEEIENWTTRKQLGNSQK